ncbi:MAG: AbrB family transcriptional regulator, partial [Alphaproteobacteria bacterium]|nr:AbrB family transcriptional regulator [Alphaproteobacteria bacterium]
MSEATETQGADIRASDSKRAGGPTVAMKRYAFRFGTTVLRRTAEALLIGALGGVAVNATGMPAGLISGSVIAVAIAAIAGRPVTVPVPLARAVFVLVGIALGAIVSPEILQGLTAYPLSLAILATSTFCMIAATSFYLRQVHRWDPLSALFGASPGALAQAMAMSAEVGADLRAIVIVQTIRVVMLTVGIPAGLALFGFELPPGGPVRAAASLVDLAVLLPAALIPAFILYRVGFQGGWLFGAMLGSGALHGGGFIHGTLPWWVYDAAVIVLGTVTGARFANTNPRLLVRLVGAGLGSFAVSGVIAVLFMGMVAAVVSVQPAN